MATKPSFSIKILLLTLALFAAGCAPPKHSAKTIVVWHWLNDRREALDNLAQKYRAATGIDVEFKLFFPPDIYVQKVVAAARAGNLPDIFGVLGEKSSLASFIKAGHIADLTAVMNQENGAWKNSFYPQTLGSAIFTANNTYGIAAGIYGVPIDTAVMQFIYNRTLLDRIGVTGPPKTLDALIDDSLMIENKLPGVYGFICGWGEPWLLNCLFTQWAVNEMGEAKVIATIKGDVPYTDKDWIEVFGLFARLRQSGILAPNIATTINKEAEDAFARGKAAFSFNGSWSINVYNELNPGLDYVFFPLPRVSTKNPLKIWGGAGSIFMINNRSPNKDKALAFLRWLTSPAQQRYLTGATDNLPAVKGCDDVIPERLKPVLGMMGQLIHPSRWPVNEDPGVTDLLNKCLQQIVIGLKTPEAAAKEVQEFKEQVNR